MPKMLLIGLDGATFDVIRPLAAAGRLPNLTRLMRRGAWGVLQSTVPPITPTAWTSVFTGKNPGKHGIYDFQAIDPKNYERRPVHIDRHREKTLWDLLGMSGKRSIVIDVPYTYPPRPLNGRMLTGYGTPRRPETVFTFPADFRQGLPTELHNEIRVGLPIHRFDRSEELISEWHEVMNGRSRLLTHLISQEEWDFFFTVFNITDNLGHVFWTFIDPNHPNYDKPKAETFREAFFNAYEQCDALVGQLCELAGPGVNTIIMSDHGFGSIYTRQYLFQRLFEGGFIEYKGGNDRVSWRSTIIKQLVRTYNRFPFLREWVKGLHPNSKKALGNSLRQSGLMPDPGAIDYKRSAVLPTDFGLQLWVNGREKFPLGPVSSDHKQEIMEQLAAHLLADRDPHSGKSIVKEVYSGKDLYVGVAASSGPDLVIEFTNFYEPGSSLFYKNPSLEGGHTQSGIFIAAGPAVETNAPANARLIDLAPTILHLLNESVPPDMDGRVLTEILSDEWQIVQRGNVAAIHDEGPQQYNFSAEEEADLLEQLRQLGYVD